MQLIVRALDQMLVKLIFVNKRGHWKRLLFQNCIVSLGHKNDGPAAMFVDNYSFVWWIIVTNLHNYFVLWLLLIIKTGLMC